MKQFEEIFIDREAQDTVLARKIMEAAPPESVHLVADRTEAEKGAGGKAASRPGFKHRLFITLEKGRFLRRCPGTPTMRCCNLFVLNPVVGCHYDCTYCFLQAYQTDPFITLHANLDDLDREVFALLSRNRGALLRICTGELADSLALEPLTDVAVHLVNLFAPLQGALLELKTKSTRIQPLLELDHGGRTVVSWSLNTDPVAAQEELGSPGPGARIRAAAQVAAAGYPVAFHFDPLLRYDGWEQDYMGLVEKLFHTVPAGAVQWISLGGFRYTTGMKAQILQRFPRTRLFHEEFMPCPDGKYRYFSKHRAALYRTMLAAIRSRGPRVPVYLCMEADHMWRKVFGALPQELEEVKALFEDREE